MNACEDLLMKFFKMHPQCVSDQALHRFEARHTDDVIADTTSEKTTFFNHAQNSALWHFTDTAVVRV